MNIEHKLLLTELKTKLFKLLRFYFSFCAEPLFLHSSFHGNWYAVVWLFSCERNDMFQIFTITQHSNPLSFLRQCFFSLSISLCVHLIYFTTFRWIRKPWTIFISVQIHWINLTEAILSGTDVHFVISEKLIIL